MDTLTNLVVAEHPVVFVAVPESEHTRVGMEAVGINRPEAYIGIDYHIQRHAAAVSTVVSYLKNIAFEIVSVFACQKLTDIALAIAEHQKCLALESEAEGRARVIAPGEWLWGIVLVSVQYLDLASREAHTLTAMDIPMSRSCDLKAFDYMMKRV